MFSFVLIALTIAFVAWCLVQVVPAKPWVAQAALFVTLLCLVLLAWGIRLEVS